MVKIKTLSALTVNTLPDDYHADGANLFLRVRGESRVWFFRYKKLGKQISFGLGATHTRSSRGSKKTVGRSTLFITMLLEEHCVTLKSIKTAFEGFDGLYKITKYVKNKYDL